MSNQPIDGVLGCPLPGEPLLSEQMANWDSLHKPSDAESYVVGVRAIEKRLAESEAERVKLVRDRDELGRKAAELELRNAELDAVRDAMWRGFCTCKGTPGDCPACRISCKGSHILQSHLDAATKPLQEKIGALEKERDELAAAVEELRSLRDHFGVHDYWEKSAQCLAKIQESASAILREHDAEKGREIAEWKNAAQRAREQRYRLAIALKDHAEDLPEDLDLRTLVHQHDYILTGPLAEALRVLKGIFRAVCSSHGPATYTLYQRELDQVDAALAPYEKRPACQTCNGTRVVKGHFTNDPEKRQLEVACPTCADEQKEKPDAPKN